MPVELPESKYVMASAPTPAKPKKRITATQRRRWNQVTADGFRGRFDKLCDIGCNTDFDNEQSRYRLTKQARHEVDRNAYFTGMLNVRRNDLIGSRPRIKFADKSNIEATSELNQKANSWLKEIGLGKKLRLAILQYDRDGESGLIFKANPNLNHEVKLGVQVFEQEDLDTSREGSGEKEGIVRDQYGNITHYRLFKRQFNETNETYLRKSERVPHEFVCHFFDQKRSKQSRGYSRLASILETGEDMRDYRRASAKKAKKNAGITGVVAGGSYTDDEGDDLCYEPGDAIDIEEGSLLCVPGDGITISEIGHNQNVDGIDVFTATAMTEGGRALTMARNKAIGSSKEYNFASGKLDNLDGYRATSVERFDIECDCLDKAAYLFLLNAYATQGYLTEATSRYLDQYILSDLRKLPPHTWQWDAHPDIDLGKETTARAKALATGQTTLTKIWADKGGCWDGPEGGAVELASDLGISVEQLKSKLCKQIFDKADQIQAPSPVPQAIAEEVTAQLEEAHNYGQ